MTVSMGMLIFAGLAYALEKDEPDTTFYTLPQTLYWAIITMTSTGYGDVAPKTSGGKFIASLCAICGVLCITLPIPIIVTNFNRYKTNYNCDKVVLAWLWLILLPVTRYYEKSIIEQAINQERSSRAAYWEETKKSIREARYRLSLSNNSDLAGSEVEGRGGEGEYCNTDFITLQKLKNGLKSPHDTETSLDTHASGPDKDDLYLDLINPWMYIV